MDAVIRDVSCSGNFLKCSREWECQQRMCAWQVYCGTIVVMLFCCICRQFFNDAILYIGVILYIGRTSNLIKFRLNNYSKVSLLSSIEKFVLDKGKRFTMVKTEQLFVTKTV